MTYWLDNYRGPRLSRNKSTEEVNPYDEAVDFMQKFGDDDAVKDIFLRGKTEGPEREDAAQRWDSVLAVRAHQAQQEADWKAAHPVSRVGQDPNAAILNAAHAAGLPVTAQRNRGDEFADEVSISPAAFFPEIRR